ncbi:hypothetical protein [Acuticoccus sediminis]|uniref:hypothetical protein n=1 Tax=Acuticoccus sediminis TaxID=2184697 RepID=UPI0011B93E9C|nr:hypothetical protein [Acuticoccus sediminis]
MGELDRVRGRRPDRLGEVRLEAFRQVRPAAGPPGQPLRADGDVDLAKVHPAAGAAHEPLRLGAVDELAARRPVRAGTQAEEAAAELEVHLALEDDRAGETGPLDELGDEVVQLHGVAGVDDEAGAQLGEGVAPHEGVAAERGGRADTELGSDDDGGVFDPAVGDQIGVVGVMRDGCGQATLL